MEKLRASVTVQVEVFDQQAMWDHAYKIYDESMPNVSSDQTYLEFVEMCGPRDEPKIGDCLQMIFDPGESPPGVQINDSSTEVEAPF